ncbi:MAG: sensor histidine kinase [Planctomycetota bacterium]|jgi:heavy metal sensor kinase
MRSSIRWTLISWYGLLLTAVLATFGTVLFWRVSASAMASVDATLSTRASVIAGALEWDGDEEHEPGTGLRGWDLELSADYLSEIASGGCFVVWDRDGEVLLRRGPDGPARPTGVRGAHSRGPDFRQIEIDGRHGTRVLVGTSIVRERRQAAALLATIVGVGIGVLAVAMLGGWWLARRSVAPIERMAHAAAAIDEHGLASRLEIAGTPAELHGLVGAFNATLERLEAAFTRQTRFTADASHELRTPVAIVRTQAEAALRAARTPGEYRESLEACLRAATRMTAIVEGLLTLARADSGGVVARSRVDLAPVVEEAAAQVRPQAAEEGVTLSCDTEAVEVHGDAGLLGEVVTNLLANAVLYNRPGGRVDVALSADDGVAVLRVRDTGLGIPVEALPQLFERFFRVDPARSRERGGSGLGLSITRWIVEAHGGEIAVESTESEGSTFTVRLPRAIDA